MLSRSDLKGGLCYIIRFYQHILDYVYMRRVYRNEYGKENSFHGQNKYSS